MVKIARYKGLNINFIDKDVNHSGKRIILISFSAKVIGGRHRLLFVAKHAGEYIWIHNAFKKFEITSESWADFSYFVLVPPTEDFDVHFEDREIKNANSSIQIRNLVIAEPID